VVSSGTVTETDKAWMVELEINNQLQKFKIDTGAAVTAVPKSFMKFLPTLQTTKKTLKGAGNHKLEVLGQTSVNLKFQEKCMKDMVYVIDGLVNPLLGKPAIAELGVLGFIQEVDIENQWKNRFPKLFQGLGSFGNDVKITLREECVPFCQVTPRRVAAARRQPLLNELNRMEKLGVISKVKGPTDWCSPCVVVPKKDGRIRLCIDYTKLNESVKRECHPLPTTEETLSMLGSASHFSKLDANSGYWQMRILDESKHLTTFITPFGRYLCDRLPFGISSAPEIFQKQMQRVVGDLPGVLCQMDDILVCGKSQQEHDLRLNQVLQRLQGAGLTLNADKCEFNRTTVKFLGHIIDKVGIHADPAKTQAIVEFPTPTNRKELRRFFGMVNYLGKFTPTLAEGSRRLRELLGKDSVWTWSPEHNEEFVKLKRILANTPILVPFKIDAQTILSTDASSYGLGAVILQREDDKSCWKPVAYASRTLSTAEQRYAQIEKEALAICWGCEKFDYFLAGREFTVETDHKPLVSVLGSKELAKLPVRVQRFRLRMMAYSYKIIYTPGEKLVLADTLSRAPLLGETKEPTKSSESVDSGICNSIIEEISISPKRVSKMRAVMLEESESILLQKYITEGWPQYNQLPIEMKSFFTFKDYLTCIDGLVFYMDRLYVPVMERAKVLEDIHAGHQGEVKCINRAVQVVWWPGLTRDVREMVKSCGICMRLRRVAVEPLQQTPLPERAWWRVGIDLFEKDGKDFLVVVDYYSRFLTVHELTIDTSSHTIVKVLEELFCTLGIPNTVVSDNGPQFISEKFKKFIDRWDIAHVTSSPRYPQSNGEAERAVQTAKSLMSKNLNYQAALCAYRDTPVSGKYSPAQLMFGRSMNSMGIHKDQRVDLQRFRIIEADKRAVQAMHYNRRHRVQERIPLQVEQRVVVNDAAKPPQDAKVIATSGRETVVLTDKQGLLRRNRAFLSLKEKDVTCDKSDVDGTSPKSEDTQLESRSRCEITRSTCDDKETQSPAQCSPNRRQNVPKVGQVERQLTTPNNENIVRTSRGRVSRKPNRLNL